MLSEKKLAVIYHVLPENPSNPLRRGLQIQPSRDFLKLLIGDPQIAFGVGQTAVVEFMHDQGQVDALLAGVIAPGFSQGVGTIVVLQADVMGESGDNFPGLLAANRGTAIVGFGIEKDTVGGHSLYGRVGRSVGEQSLGHAEVSEQHTCCR